MATTHPQPPTPSPAASIGPRVTAIAHDFNNLLTTILGYSHLVADELPDRPLLLAHIDEICQAAERASLLSTQLLEAGRSLATAHATAPDAADAAPGAENGEEVASAAQGAPRTADAEETVLVLEDDAVLRDLIQVMLEGAGYTVLCTEGIAAALQTVKIHQGPIHLILTDIVMPGVSGPEAAGRLLAERPEARVLFVSGYNRDAIGRRNLLPPSALLLEKPFSERALVDKVREALDSPIHVT